MNEQMIEAVAKAIYVAYVKNPNAGWDARNPTKKSNIWFLQAPAAIAAAEPLIRTLVFQEIREAAEAVTDAYAQDECGQAIVAALKALEKKP
jgi:hypothetical protein